MPRAKGLFHRAIVQSGNTRNVTSAPTAERISRRLGEVLGVDPTREAIAATSPGGPSGQGEAAGVLELFTQ